MKRIGIIFSALGFVLAVSAAFATRSSAVEIQGWEQIEGSSIACEISAVCDNQPGIPCTFAGAQLYRKNGSTCTVALTRSAP